MKILSLLIIGLYLSFNPLTASTTTGPELKNWGLKQIHAPQAWQIQEGSPKVIVAVVDTGVDRYHRDLASNIWHDPKDSSVYGWNFVTNRSNPTDDNNHGSHVSGIIDSLLDSENGTSGVAHHVTIMPLKYYADYNPGYINLRHTIEAMNYAITHGAKLINYSGGGPEFNEDEYIELKKAESNGILVVCAAGNESQNIDMMENYYYPASYHLSNIISVASSDITDHLSTGSNWGANRVDIAAPGENIYSTLPGDRFGSMSGTSMATAFVTGAAALLLSEKPRLTPAQVRRLLIDSADRVPALAGHVVSGGRLNVYEALALSRKRY
jgi:thermitase